MRILSILRESLICSMLLVVVFFIAMASHLPAGIIIATGQNNGDPSHTSGNYYYSINTNTGIATPLSPLLSGSSSAGLATVGSQLVGFQNSRHGTIDPIAGVFTSLLLALLALPGTCLYYRRRIRTLSCR